MNKFTTLATGMTLAVASLGAFAQVSVPSTPRVNRHEASQQARIDAGVASGQLTRREARRLDAAGSDPRRRTPRQGRRRRHAAGAPPYRSAAEAGERNIHAQKHDAQVAQRPY